ncbi:arylsulfatase [Planctomycetota bacterium]
MTGKILRAVPSILILLLWAFPPANAGEIHSKDKPNVIIVITDDQGMGDLGCQGNPYIRTPHIDNFYEEAVRFTNFHVSSKCAPTRGALMSGRHTNRLNVYNTLTGRSLLFEDEVILPQVFAQNGYINGMFGKWHLGDNYPFRPEDRGFQEVVRHGGGGVTQAPDYWGNDLFDDIYWHNGKTEQYTGYCTDVFFAEALRFIEENKDRPFFCYISTNAPHGPHNLPEQYYNMYREMEADGLNDGVKRFYGMITNIDDNFRTLRKKLDALNLTDNTILIFMTDNGTAVGQQVFNAGMRGNKGSEYEGGHRVPFFIYWPEGGLTGGRDIDQLVAHYDLFPTFVDLLGFDFHAVKPLDGISLKPLLLETKSKWPNRILTVDTQRGQNLVKYRTYAVMDNNWRLVNGNELYHMDEDRSQANNVIKLYPEIAGRLAQGYERWWQSFLDEGVDERYAYIKVGSPHDNPSRISAYDMMTGKFANIWHQRASAEASQATGRWKIEFTVDGEYSISLRRFPRESGLAINETFPEQERRIELERIMSASTKTDFVEAYLYVADLQGSQRIKPGQDEVTFRKKISAGKYDMEAQLIDSENRVHPAYYVYIEKL